MAAITFDEASIQVAEQKKLVQWGYPCGEKIRSARGHFFRVRDTN